MTIISSMRAGKKSAKAIWRRQTLYKQQYRGGIVFYGGNIEAAYFFVDTAEFSKDVA